MPAYNAEKYITEAIDSILNQTYHNFELIIADDCSTDKTWQIIREYSEKDPRIVAIQNKKNLYIAENRNNLISLAKGEYIAWQDADDISLSDRLEKQYLFLKNNPEVGIIGGYLQFFNEKGEISIRKYETEDNQIRKTIFRYSPVAQPAAMIPKKCLIETGNYNPEYPPAEDIDMNFRIGEKYKFANLPQIVIKYRVNENSATFNKLRKIEFVTLYIRSKYIFNVKYSFNLLDVIYNFIQFISIFLIPTKLKITLFNLIRNK